MNDIISPAGPTCQTNSFRIYFKERVKINNFEALATTTVTFSHPTFLRAKSLMFKIVYLTLDTRGNLLDEVKKFSMDVSKTTRQLKCILTFVDSTDNGFICSKC